LKERIVVLDPRNAVGWEWLQREAHISKKEDGIWLAGFMHGDLGYFDLE
jgi:hypothetical protein